MRVYHSHVLSFVLFLLCSIEKGSSIFCYDCNSAFDPRCGEEFDPFSLGVVNCSLREPPDHIDVTEPTLCRRIKMEINGKVRIVRQCGYLSDGAGPSCRRQTSTGDLFVTYCSCDTDLCNGTKKSNMATGFTFLTAVIMLVVQI